MMIDESSTQPLRRVTRVAIVEDNTKYREMLALLIGNTEGYCCTGAYRSMEEALEKIGFNQPDGAVIDIGLPGMSGRHGSEILKQRYPTLLLLMLTIFDDDDRIFDALRAGAAGYLLKKTQPARLLDALTEALGGGAPMSPEVARRVLALFREIPPPKRVDYN